MKKNVDKLIIGQSDKLIIGKSDKRPLNKAQQTFNRLVKKLEKLRREFEQTNQILNEKLEFYVAHIRPLELETAKMRGDLAKRLHEFYQTEKRLSAKDREVLREIIAVQLDDALAFSDAAPDDEMKSVFQTVEGITFEEAAAEDFAAMKADMKQTFAEFGIEVDLDDFNADLSEAEMMGKMAEMLDKAQRQAESQRAAAEAEEAATREPREKTKRQLDKEERKRQIAEAKNKSIASVYKQLARVFHPDLEQDPTRKAEKEDLMKRLTAAYDENDLHSLLRLEVEWIQKEENNLDRLTDEKLSIYNEMLKEQARELEAEIFGLSRHPRFESLQRFGLLPFFKPQHLDLAREKTMMQRQIKEMRESLDEFNGSNAFAELRKIIKLFKKQRSQRPVNFFELDLNDILR